MSDQAATVLPEPAMPGLVLGPMLRYVNTHAATVWVEASSPCTVEVVPVDDDPLREGLTASTSPLGRARTFTVHGHHYALVVIEGLEPGTSVAYEVHLDGVRHWPEEASPFPPSRIRTIRPGAPVRIVFGSCRATAPHEPPYTLRNEDDPHGVGVDALRAMGLRIAAEPPDTWPQLLLLAGDQVYADASSPSTQARIDRRRGNGGNGGNGWNGGNGDAPPEIPDEVVADFEEYTWLYRESWSPDVERWLLSTVPSAMIFDDHDMIDDWNISQSWVRDIRSLPWWGEHVVGGLVSYWVHQHLGNLAPERLRDEGMLQACLDAGDATELLRAWALSSEEFTPVPGGYRFSFERHLGQVHLVVMDVRNGRVLEPGHRRMLDDDEWSWVAERVMEPAEHLVIASSLPVFVPGGLHGIQQWNEAICDGRWGRRAARLGERMRRAIDLEGWPAFRRSFLALEQLLVDVATDTTQHRAPHTVTIVGGDIHFAYVADVDLPDTCRSTLRQVVCSPLRNILRPRDRRVMRFGSSRVGRRIGGWLGRTVSRESTRLSWRLTEGPVFDDNIGTLDVDGPSCSVTIEVARLDDAGAPVLRPAIGGPVGSRSRRGLTTAR